MTTRTVGKYGRLSAKFPAGLHDLTHYAAGALPKAPASVAVPDVPDWGMDGNGPDPSCTVAPEGVGDCGVAGLNHLLMSAAAATRETETFPSADQVVSYYLSYTGGQDTGVVLSDFLAYVAEHGFYGHKVAAYAPVRVSDIPTLQFAVNAYDAAYCGIAVTQAMEQAFAAGLPWTADVADSPVVGGHCVPVVGYDSQYLYIVTWGQVQSVAYSAWHHIASEAWAVIPGEITEAGTDGHGVNLAALQADLGKLDAPAPAPVPQPDNKSLLQEIASLIREAEVTADKPFAVLGAWLREHHL